MTLTMRHRTVHDQQPLLTTTVQLSYTVAVARAAASADERAGHLAAQRGDLGDREADVQAPGRLEVVGEVVM
jgi:hypothetical protein